MTPTGHFPKFKNQISVFFIYGRYETIPFSSIHNLLHHQVLQPRPFRRKSGHSLKPSDQSIGSNALILLYHIMHYKMSRFIEPESRTKSSSRLLVKSSSDHPGRLGLLYGGSSDTMKFFISYKSKPDLLGPPSTAASAR